MKTDDKMTEMAEINTKLDKIIALFESNMIIKKKEFTIDHRNYEMIDKAAACGRLDVVQFIKKDYNASYETHLKYATAQGNIDIVKYFIKHSNDDNIAFYVNSALYQAISHEHLNIVKYLVEEAGANIHVDNAALQNVKYICNAEIIEYLQSKRAEISANEVQRFIDESCENAEIQTVVNTAVISGRLDIIKHFVKNGDIYNKDINDMLQDAVCYGHLNVVKYLNEELKSPYINYDKALKIAFDKGHQEIFKYLINYDTTNK